MANARESGGTSQKKQRKRNLRNLGEGKDFQKGEAVGGKKAGGDDGLGAARESYRAVTGRSLDGDSSASRKSTLSSASRKSKQKEIDEGGYSQSAHDAAVAKKKGSVETTTSTGEKKQRRRNLPNLGEGKDFQATPMNSEKGTKLIKESRSSVDDSLKMNKMITADRSGVQSTIKRTNPYTKKTAKVEQQKAARQGAKQAQKYSSYATQSLKKGFAQSKKKGKR